MEAQTPANKVHGDPLLCNDIPLPGAPPPPATEKKDVTPSLPTLPPQLAVATPGIPAPSKKGIEQAMKKLRAFSIQRKQTVPAVAKAAMTATDGNVLETKGKLEKLKTKLEKQRKLPSTHPMFNPILDTAVESEELKRKREIAELGIPLSLIQPGHQAMPNKAWPSKAMPPTYLLNDLIDPPRISRPKRSRRDLVNRSPDQVNEIIMKAREAKAKGITLKFNYKDYFPTYENPFQQGRIRAESTGDNKDDRNKPKISERQNTHTKSRYDEPKTKTKKLYKRVSKWDDDKTKSFEGDKLSSKEKVDKDKELRLNDFVVCDSWSLETEDKTDEGTPKSDSKSINSLKEQSENKNKDGFIEVNDKDIEIPIELPKSKANQKVNESDLCDVRIKEDVNKKMLFEALVNEKPAAEKLRPVVDEFMYDLDDNSSDGSLDSKKTKDKSRSIDTTIVKQQIVTKDGQCKEIFETDELIPMPARQTSKSPNKSRESKDKISKKDKSGSVSNPSRKNDSHETPEENDKDMNDNHSSSPKSQAPESPKIGADETDVSKLTEPRTPDFDEDSKNYTGKYDIQEQKNETPETLNKTKMSKEMGVSLDTWNFVLKICQPLLFRHDRNKCYRETKHQPSMWYTENPRICACVKDREIVYDELYVTKMDLVDKVYGCDQIPDDTPQTSRPWYQEEGNCIAETSNILSLTPQKPVKTATDNKKSTSSPVPPAISEFEERPTVKYSAGHKTSLDREYEKFMEAVWTDKTKSPKNDKKVDSTKISEKELRKDKTVESPSQRKEKSREATSELGTSMDESMMSVEDLDVRSKKKKRNEKELKKSKATSEYWSEESDAGNLQKSQEKIRGKEDKKKKTKKRQKAKIRSPSSSDSDSSEEESDVEIISKKSKDGKDKKKKLSKALKEKLSRKKKLEKKRKLKKMKEKRLKKLKKLKEKVQKSLEDDEDVGEIIKKEKQKKKEEVKVKDKRKVKRSKKEESKKKKKVSSSSSSSTSDSSSSDSEEEKKKRRKRKKKEEAKAEKEKKKEKLKKRKAAESYSENEEEFDMNVLNNIKMEQVSDEEKVQIEDFSPRRPLTSKVKEIVSVNELHSDFVGRAIKTERIEVDDSIQECRIKRVEELKRAESGSPKEKRDKMTEEKNSVIVVEEVISAESPNIEIVKTFVQTEPEPIIVQKEEIIKYQPTETIFQETDSVEIPLPQSNISVVLTEKKLYDNTEINHCTESINVKSGDYSNPIKVNISGENIEAKTYAEIKVSCEKRDRISDDKIEPQRVYDTEMPKDLGITCAIQIPAAPQPPELVTECDARPIETVVSASSNRGEIKCDWRPVNDAVRSGATAKMSRWGMQSKPGEANIVLTSPESVYPIRSVLESEAPAPQYRIETISNVHHSENHNDYDGAYADTYGESDRLQYGDCFAPDERPCPAPEPQPVEEETKKVVSKGRLSLDDRIGLVLQESALAEIAKYEQPKPAPIQNGILVNRLSPSGRESVSRRPGAAVKRVVFSDGYKPGQDSDEEQPPTQKKPRRRYGCAWPCPAHHPDHVPLWDALPPPPPPPGSPPPPPAPQPAPPELLRMRKRRRHDRLNPEFPPHLLPPEEPVPKVTRLPKVHSHPIA